jgi:hypothetical protein
MTTDEDKVFELRSKAAKLFTRDPESINHEAAGWRGFPIQLIQKQIELFRSST